MIHDSGKGENGALTASVCLGSQGKFGERRKRKTVRFTARVSPAVAEAKAADETWSNWVTFLTKNYQRSHLSSPVCDPTSRRLLEWAAVTLDVIGHRATGAALQAVDKAPSDRGPLDHAILIHLELVRIRQALDAWQTQPFTPSGEEGE